MLKAFTEKLLLVAGLTMAATASSSAHGAIAIGGNTADTAKYGIAVGYAVNQSSKDEAVAQAIAQCKTYPSNNPAETTAHCELTASFDHEWLAISLDPKNGTPGFGWSVDSHKKSAERNAMSQCRASSPNERKKFCVISLSKRDQKP